MAIKDLDLSQQLVALPPLRLAVVRAQLDLLLSRPELRDEIAAELRFVLRLPYRQLPRTARKPVGGGEEVHRKAVQAREPDVHGGEQAAQEASVVIRGPWA